jgi:hypothetical protein
MTAPMVIDGAKNGEAFRACVRHMRAEPQPRRRRRHGQPAGSQGRRRPRDDRGGPPRLPDLNPIEQAFAKLKALLRKAAARTLDAHGEAIAAALDAFFPDECADYVTASGYEPD